jgi:putative salt-induced outer membrane protein YdiY
MLLSIPFKKFNLIFVLIISSQFLYAQSDSLVLINGNQIVGEVKGLNRNVLTVETNYSDEDFKIEWDGVMKIYTETYFLITLTDGTRLNGRLTTISPLRISVISEDGQEAEVELNNIVYLDDIKKGFWNQLYASIDLGLDIAKASNLRQVSMRSNLGYLAKRWQLDGNYSNLFSRQDDTDDTRRIDGAVTFRYFLPRDWYPLLSAEFLSNTEQQLKLRSTVKTGMGKYVINTNQFYWGFSVGANYNNENFEPDTISDRKSWEGFLGTELNLFNTGDLSLLTNLIAYPSFTEKGRLRSDFKFDLKYDLPLDFYIKLGFTVNYDNQPAAGSPETDYVIHSGFGWEW